MGKKKKKKKRIVKKIMIRGKVFKKSFEKKSDAEFWYEEMKNEAIRSKSEGQFNSNLIALKGIRFDEVVEKFLSTRVNIKPTTLEDYISTTRNHILPSMRVNKKFKKMYEITKSDGLLMIKNMQENNLSDSTINKALICLKSIGKFAKEENFWNDNIFSSIKPLKIDPTDYPHWNPTTASEFLKKSVNHNLHKVFKFALNTGLRRGEILGLMGKNIKQSENGSKYLSFTEQLLPGRVRQSVKGGRKRIVPLTQIALNVLDSIGNIRDDEYVFTMPNGQPIDPNYLTTEFKKEQRRQFIVDKKRIPTREEADCFMKFHGTRHSFATELSTKNIPIQKIALLVGHRSTKVTERYLHASKDDLSNTVQVINFE